MQFNFAFVASLLAATSVQAIDVKVYDSPSGKGGYVTLDVQPHECKTLSDAWKNRIESFSKPRGKTCRVYDRNSCQGKGSRIYDKGQDLICSLVEFNNAVNSIKCW
ncbi:hypothetical protein IWW34DRAFT_604529 [Fusarium oxysporum f. sp. albedinis]|uniref:Uncharacterized protein n=1 Tax=Fusarium oxysporum f. sp. narcissi TaxID=451672 RepID=A0A4Q2VAS5_FUSOX|nr:hypothetical protein IWW34DRAFT_604529 [Fusarium oxysporum f. sp. albedinis]RYC81263.1 hypothetical protein BFJ63_vAg15849 [Fusarium oxysporum f. sp. narcissi]